MDMTRFLCWGEQVLGRGPEQLISRVSTALYPCAKVSSRQALLPLTHPQYGSAVR